MKRMIKSDGADSTHRTARRRERASLFCLFQAWLPQAHVLLVSTPFCRRDTSNSRLQFHTSKPPLDLREIVHRRRRSSTRKYALPILTSDANLIVAKKSAKSFEQLAKYSVADSVTHAHPVVMGKSILIKDDGAMALANID